MRTFQGFTVVALEVLKGRSRRNMHVPAFERALFCCFSIAKQNVSFFLIFFYHISLFRITLDLSAFHSGNI